MTKHICKKCGKEFDRKSSYDNHMKNKKSCIRCDICGKTYSQKSALTRHQKMKHNNKKSSERKIKDTIEEIKIIPYGTECNKIIPESKSLELLKKTVLPVTKIIEYMHCNPNFQALHNVYVMDLKIPYVDVCDGDTWKKMSREPVIDDMITDVLNFINTTFEDKQDELTTSEQTELNKRIHSIEDESCVKKLRQEILLMLYNKKSLIKRTKKIFEKYQELNSIDIEIKLFTRRVDRKKKCEENSKLIKDLRTKADAEGY